MTTLTKMTRSVKKLEVPPPLKSATSSQHARSPAPEAKITTDEELMQLTEDVAYKMLQGVSDQVLISSLYAYLKMHGAQLELNYKNELDRYFVVFRNVSQDDRFDPKIRLRLLELIELRAKHWHSSDYMSQYYRNRVTHSEPLLVPTMDGAGGGGGGGSVSPTPPPEPPPMLAPGEVLKTSGKFPKPTKIPGKNYSKDEVVIRNADSGKVMGIKGRRVHMIEELSDTIISFQRVSPGAKERLVQITGPNEENVNHAKHLIGDTIRRNASPVRLEQVETLRGSDASLNSSGSDESPRPASLAGQKSPGLKARALHHSFSTNDAALGEYKYTVTCGPHTLKITGSNLDVVKTAKLVLDEYFEREEALEGDGAGDFFTLSSRAALLSLGDACANGLPSPATSQLDDDVFASPRAHLAAHAPLPPQPPPPATPAAEENGGEVVFRRARFSRAASADKKEGPPVITNGSKNQARKDSGKGPAGAARRRYSYETLVQYARSPLARSPPAALAAFPADLARKVTAAGRPPSPPLPPLQPRPRYCSSVVTSAYSLPPRRILAAPPLPPPRHYYPTQPTAAYPARDYLARRLLTDRDLYFY